MKKESFGKLFAIVAVTGLVGIAPMQAEDDHTPLGKEMDAMSGALKSLRRSVRAKDWEGSAAKMREAQVAVINAMALVPSEIEALKDAKAKAIAISDNKRMLGLVLASFCELEMLFLSDKSDDEKAEKTDEISDVLKDLKKEGHEKYYKEE